MKLLSKFSAIFALVFGGGLIVAALLSYRFLQEDARDQVIQQAQLMMRSMNAARNYTTGQIRPLLETLQVHQRSFLPQTVPAYAATESFGYLRKAYPDYEYKEATLNPTNLRDRAVDWEADIINSFRNHPERTEFSGERQAATGPSLFLARPIRADAPCLQCHELPREAPPAMIRHYGPNNGFGWKLGEVVGAQIVSVPMSVPLRMARQGLQSLLLYLVVVFFLSLMVLNLVLYLTIAKPVARLSVMADKISLGELEIPDLPVKGHDEISQLAGSFNRMRRSLVQAMKLLGE
jgi:HAMP domain-containing protein